MKRNYKSVSHLLLLFSFIITSTVCLLGEQQLPDSLKSQLPQKIKNYIDTLYSEYSSDRARAAFYLGEMGPEAEPAIPFLINKLGDKTKFNMEVTETWIGYNRHKQSSVQWEAKIALEKMGKNAVDPLLLALKTESQSVRTHTILALGEIKDARALESLTNILLDENEPKMVRYAAAMSLGNIGSIDSRAHLIAMLGNESWEIRSGAAEALANFSDSLTVDALIRSLKDNNTSVRNSAVKSLGKIGDVRALEPLNSLLISENEKPLDKREVIWAIANTKDSKSADLLINALQIEDFHLKRELILVLGRKKCEKAILPLINLLGDEDYRRAAQISLKFITNQDFGYEKKEWHEWYDKNKSARNF